MKKITRFIGFGLLSVLLGSCATSVPVTMKKPPLINMAGVNSIVVLPFGEASDGAPSDYLKAAFYRLTDNNSRLSSRDRRVTANITNYINNAIIGTGAYRVINSGDLLVSMAGGKTVASSVDAVVNGEVLGFFVKDENGYEDRKGTDGVVRRTYRLNRRVDLRFVYRVIRTSDGAVLGEMLKSGDASDVAYGDAAFSVIRTPESLVESIIASCLGNVAHEIAPYSSTEYRVLEKDQAKDPRMAKADELVKKGMYKDALELFSAVYGETKNYAAGYNAAEMVEILGDLKGAISAMDSLYKATGNPKAQKELARMQATLADIERLSSSSK